MVYVLLFSALGIAAMVGLTWALGGLRTAVLTDREAAVDLMRRDFIEFEASDGILSVDGTAALLVPAADAERVGLVFAMGQRFATRILSPGDVISVTQVLAKCASRSVEGAASDVPASDLAAAGMSVPLELRFTDFTQPGLRVELPGGDAARRFHSRLEALCRPTLGGED
jgi:hypothetical protein